MIFYLHQNNSQLVKKALRLKVHLARDSEGNTALHLAILTQQVAKVLLMLKAIAHYDERLTMALDIPNNKRIIPLQILASKLFSTFAFKNLIDSIVCRKIYYHYKSEAMRGSLIKVSISEDQKEFYLYQSLQKIVDRLAMSTSSPSFFQSENKNKTASGWKKGFLHVNK